MCADAYEKYDLLGANKLTIGGPEVMEKVLHDQRYIMKSSPIVKIEIRSEVVSEEEFDDLDQEHHQNQRGDQMIINLERVVLQSIHVEKATSL